MKTVVFAHRTMGVQGIESLLRAGYSIARVHGHAHGPDESEWHSSVADLCAAKGLDFSDATDLSSPEAVAKLQALEPEIAFNFDYQFPLANQVLALPPAGTLTLHPSLLPAYHAPQPIVRALIAGEKKTGVTLYYEQPGQKELETSHSPQLTQYAEYP